MPNFQFINNSVYVWQFIHIHGKNKSGAVQTPIILYIFFIYWL